MINRLLIWWKHRNDWDVKALRRIKKDWVKLNRIDELEVRLTMLEWRIEDLEKGVEDEES